MEAAHPPTAPVHGVTLEKWSRGGASSWAWVSEGKEQCTLHAPTLTRLTGRLASAPFLTICPGDAVILQVPTNPAKQPRFSPELCFPCEALQPLQGLWASRPLVLGHLVVTSAAPRPMANDGITFLLNP